MSRPKIIRELKLKHPKLTKFQIELIIDTFFNTIAKGIIDGKNFEIRGFGNFYLKTIQANFKARNPKSGKLIYVPKRNRIRFRASKKLKEFINK